MRVVITGITGFVGGHLAEHLRAAGDTLLGLATEPAWPADAPAALADVPLVAWDLCQELDAEARRRLSDFRPEAVVHLAALSVPAECGTDAPTGAAWAANVEGTRRVAEWALGLPRPPRLLFTSTSHVYAPATAAHCVMAETDPVAPVRGYGQTKLAAERVLLGLHQDRGLDVIVARAFQHVGPRQRPVMMLAEWCRQFALGGAGPVRVQTRRAVIDLTDVRDVVRAYRLLLEQAPEGTVVNVGSGVPRQTGEVLDRLRAMADPLRPIEELHPVAKQDPIADLGRLRSLVDWRPQVPLDETLRDTLADWRARVAAGNAGA